MLFDRMKHILSIILIVFSSAIASGADRLESVCYGTPEKGRIENAWQLPASGANFSAYSALGTASGRNYVHSKVYAVVIDAYAALKQHFGEKVFVYGETGWKNGGGFRPHKTHQNGLSVDFSSLSSTGQADRSRSRPMSSTSSATISSSTRRDGTRIIQSTSKRWPTTCSRSRTPRTNGELRSGA